MLKKTDNSTALGVYVASETIEAVLLQRSGERTEVVRRFARQRVAQSEFASAQELAMAVPDLKGSDDADYTLEVGDGSMGGGSASLLPSELDQLGVKKDDLGQPGIQGIPRGGIVRGGATKRPPFASQLKDILQECRALGYENPQVAFCVAPPDVAYIQLPVPSTDKPKGKAKEQQTAFSSAERKALLETLPQHHNGVIDNNRVAFLPLAETRAQRRALALVANPAEPVSTTLAALREQHVGVQPRFLDTEVSAYAALLAHTLKPGADEQSAFVRVGTEDTLVLFFKGTQLQHLERLRSLTAFDAPDTVCSRVLLQQDENRIGKLHNVFVAGAGESKPLLDAFRSYYEHAAIEPMHQVLADSGLALPDEEEAYTKAQTLPALTVALRFLEGWETATVNLLPKGLQRRRQGFTVAWHTILAAVLLLGMVGLSIVRYQAKATEVNEVRQEFLRNPVAPPAQNPDALQSRVDSLEQAHATYTRALNILDSLLIGSDKWVQTAERISRATAATPQTWVDEIQPEGTQAMRINGHALSRLAIVDLSRRLDGAIEQLNYQDVGERRVYSYEMVFPAPEELPSAANYLRNIQPGEANPEGPAEVRPAQHDH